VDRDEKMDGIGSITLTVCSFDRPMDLYPFQSRILFLPRSENESLKIIDFDKHNNYFFIIYLVQPVHA